MSSCPEIGMLLTMYTPTAGDWCKPLVAESYQNGLLIFCLENILIDSSLPKWQNFLLFSRCGKTSPDHSIVIGIISADCPFDEQTSEQNNAILYFLRHFCIWGLRKYCQTLRVLGQTLGRPDIWSLQKYNESIIIQDSWFL